MKIWLSMWKALKLLHAESINGAKGGQWAAAYRPVSSSGEKRAKGVPLGQTQRWRWGLPLRSQLSVTSGGLKTAKGGPGAGETLSSEQVNLKASIGSRWRWGLDSCSVCSGLEGSHHCEVPELELFDWSTLPSLPCLTGCNHISFMFS